MIERLREKRLVKWILIAALIATAAGVGIIIQQHAVAAPPTAPHQSVVFACTPTGVASFDTRIHVRCSTPYTYYDVGGSPSSIYWFAFPNRDSATASRMLSLATSAQLAGKNLAIFFNPDDLSGGSWGCQTGDCRVMWGLELKP